MEENSKSKYWLWGLVIFAGILAGLALLNSMYSIRFISLNNSIVFAMIIIPIYIASLIIKIIISLLKYKK